MKELTIVVVVVVLIVVLVFIVVLVVVVVVVCMYLRVLYITAITFNCAENVINIHPITIISIPFILI